jgi:hypothetical protein
MTPIGYTQAGVCGVVRVARVYVYLIGGLGDRRLRESEGISQDLGADGGCGTVPDSAR